MPMLKSWMEELAYEWLQLKGYLVILNIRLNGGVRGKLKKQTLCVFDFSESLEGYGWTKMTKEAPEIVHVEVGPLAQRFEKTLK